MLNRNRQRGIALELVLLGVAGVFVVGALGTAVYQIRAGGKAAGVLEERPKTEAATKRALAAELRVAEIDGQLTAAIASAQRALKTIEELRATFAGVQAELDGIKRTQAEQEAKTRKALADFAVRDKRQTAENARLRAIIASPVLTEGVLDEADAILRSYIRDRGSVH